MCTSVFSRLLPFLPALLLAVGLGLPYEAGAVNRSPQGPPDPAVDAHPTNATVTPIAIVTPAPTPAAPSSEVHLHIDADITDGTRPCDPITATASVAVGGMHKVGVCLESYVPNSVDAFELHIRYTGDPDDGPPTTINVATEIADVAPALDDNPDANDGDDPAGFKLGSGWDCTAFGIQFPVGEDPSTVGVADAVIVCNANLAAPDLDLSADPGLLATIEFTASTVGVDTIDFGPIDGSNKNAVSDPQPGPKAARCGTLIPDQQIGCFGATISKVVPALKIGALLPLTGELGWLGPSLLNAANLAASHINNGGGVRGGLIGVVQGDTQSDPLEGANEAGRLIDTEGVNVIVGAAASGVTRTVAEGVTVPRGVLQISPASTAPAITTLADSDLLFRTALSDTSQAEILAELAQELEYQTASTLYVNNDYGQGLSDAFATEFERLGGTVLFTVPHEPELSSCDAQMQAAGSPDVLVVLSYLDDAKLCVKTAKDDPLIPIDQFLFTDGSKAQELIDYVCGPGGGCLDGMYGTAPYSLNSPAGLAFDVAYEDVYGAPPPVYARETYDAVMMAALAAEAAGSSDPLPIRDELRDVSRAPGDVVGLGDGGIAYALDQVRLEPAVDYAGTSGCVDLDANGDIICGGIEVWRIGSGAIVTDRIEPVWLVPQLRTDMDPRTTDVDGSVLVDVGIRTTFDVDVVVEDVPAPGLKAFQFDLTYDDGIVRAGTPVAAPFLGTVTCTEASADADPGQGPGRGRARLACQTLGSPPSGSGVIATIPFEVYSVEELELIQEGTVNFDFDNVSLLNGDELYFLVDLAGGTATITGQLDVAAGTGGDCGFNGDGAAEETELCSPKGEAWSDNPGLYFADTGNDAVRLLTLDAQIVTVAGRGGGCEEPCPATDATLSGPSDVALDSAGNLYIADTGHHRIRMVDTGGIITTIAGTGTGSYNGDGIPATTADLNSPAGVAVDKFGNVYIADTGNHRIRKVDTSGTISTVAGTGTAGYDPSHEGVAAVSAYLNAPRDVVFVATSPPGVPDPYVVADTENDRIRLVDANGIITTLAGNGTRAYGGDGGPAIDASLNRPQAVAADDLGQVFIADTDNNVVRKVDPQGTIHTVAGNGTAGSAGAGSSATEAQLDKPSGVSAGTRDYIANSGGNTIDEMGATMGAEPPGVLPGISPCRMGPNIAGDWLLTLLPLGLILFRRPLRRGIGMMQARVWRPATTS